MSLLRRKMARGTEMSDNKTPSVDQPSDEAIAVAYAITRGPRQDEINRLDLKGINIDKENVAAEDFDLSDSELPSREGINQKKKKKSNS